MVKAGAGPPPSHSLYSNLSPGITVLLLRTDQLDGHSCSSRAMLSSLILGHSPTTLKTGASN